MQDDVFLEHNLQFMKSALCRAARRSLPETPVASLPYSTISIATVMYAHRNAYSFLLQPTSFFYAVPFSSVPAASLVRLSS